MNKPKIDIAKICKIGGFAAMMLSSLLSGIADKKQNEAYLNKLFNDKFANKN